MPPGECSFSAGRVVAGSAGGSHGTPCSGPGFFPGSAWPVAAGFFLTGFLPAARFVFPSGPPASRIVLSSLLSTPSTLLPAARAAFRFASQRRIGPRLSGIPGADVPGTDAPRGTGVSFTRGDPATIGFSRSSGVPYRSTSMSPASPTRKWRRVPYREYSQSSQETGPVRGARRRPVIVSANSASISTIPAYRFRANRTPTRTNRPPWPSCPASWKTSLAT